MSDKGVKISDMPELTELSGDEQLPVVNQGGNFRIKLRNIKTLISKDDLGLDKVANLTPEEYPVSTATQEALDGKAATEHEHPISEVQGLGEALEGKANTDHDHTVAQVEGLQDILDDKAARQHGHQMSDVEGLENALGGKAPSNHTHSINSINGLGSALDTLQQQINQKAPSIHEHTASDITDFSTAVSAVVNENFPGAGDVTTGVLQW